MTIKEIEERSGMTRANIRFYEKEGLINPARLENGYRDYSGQDLEELEKIKLLRALDLSVETIREAKAGERSLTELLEAHLPYLNQETQRLQAAQETCRQMCCDGVSYENLQAERYLHSLHSFPAETQDRVSRVRSPWRRYFARVLDYTIYSVLLYSIILMFVPYPRASDSVFMKLMFGYVVLLVMFFVEPLFLMKFGTTPGKWILGLRITNPDDGKLRYVEGLSRTWDVIACGCGFGIPIYRLYRLIRSYLACCDSEDPLDWEEDNVVVLKDTKGYRVAVYLAACVLLAAISVLDVYGQIVPRNRGDLTIREYVENFNWFSGVSNLSDEFQLTNTGDWMTERESYREFGWITDQPNYTYATSGERLTGISFRIETQEQGMVVSDYIMERIIPVDAYVKAKGPLFSVEVDKINDMLVKHGYETWEIELYGVTVANEAKVNGYEIVDGRLYPQEGEKQSMELIFSIQQST